MMTDNQVKQIFQEKEALLEGHFQLTSGRHSETYLQCAKVLQYPQVAEQLGEALVERVMSENAGIPVRLNAVCAPALGGIILGHVVARALGARAIFAERDQASGALVLRRGFAIYPGESILAVEDVITTGGSLKEIVQLVQSSNAKLIGVAAVAERNANAVNFGTTKSVLLKLTLKDYSVQECPQCLAGVPMVKPGSRPSVPA